MTIEDWRELADDSVCLQLPPDFDENIRLLLDSCISSYDEMDAVYEEGSLKRKQLEEKLLQLMVPACQPTLQHITSEVVESSIQNFNDAASKGQVFRLAADDCREFAKNLFDKQSKGAIIKQVDWVRAKVSHRFAVLRTAKLSSLVEQYESKVKSALYGNVEGLLQRADDDTWCLIRSSLLNETKSVVSEFANALSGFEVDEHSKKKLLTRVENYAKELVEKLAEKEADEALYHMIKRFESIYNYDNLLPQIRSGREDIGAIYKTACTSSLKLLSVLAAIRLDHYDDNIEDILINALVEPYKDYYQSSSFQVLTATDKWEKIPASKTLITPRQCKALWIQFQYNTRYVIGQAISAKKANRQDNIWPLAWIVGALFVFRINEFVMLLRGGNLSDVLFIIIVSMLLTGFTFLPISKFEWIDSMLLTGYRG